MRIWYLRLVAIALAAILVGHALGQSPAVPENTFQRHIGGVQLKDQSIIDGVALMSRGAGLAVSVEYPLGKTISSPVPALKTFTANVEPGTVSEVLNRLCAIDSTFAWTRIGNMTNVAPRSVANDPSYLLNRKVGELTFRGVRAADDAVMQIADELPGSREQIALLAAGMSLGFAQPWSTTLKDVTVREVLDLIAEQLGPSYGWQFSGSQDFRIGTFHQGLLPQPSRSKKNQSEDSGAK